MSSTRYAHPQVQFWVVPLGGRDPRRVGVPSRGGAVVRSTRELIRATVLVMLAAGLAAVVLAGGLAASELGDGTQRLALSNGHIEPEDPIGRA